MGKAHAQTSQTCIFDSLIGQIKRLTIPENAAGAASNPLLTPFPSEHLHPTSQLTLHIHDESSSIASKTSHVYLLGYGLQLRRATVKIREEEEVALTLDPPWVAWAMALTLRLFRLKCFMCVWMDYS